MGINNIFNSPFDELYSNEDEARRRKRRLYIAGGAFVFLLPTMPAFIGGVSAYFDAVNENKKIAENDLRISREQLDAKGSDINQQSLWQVRQSRINDDLRSDIVKLSDGIDGINKTVFDKMDEISKQIALSSQKNEDYTKAEVNKALSGVNENARNNQDAKKVETLPLSYADKGKILEPQNIPVQVTVPETKTTPKQVLNGNLVLPPPPSSRSREPLNNNFNNSQYTNNAYTQPYTPQKALPTEFWGSNGESSTLSTLSKNSFSKKEENGELVIPMGAAKGVLLTGATLKTLEGGKSEPKAVFIKLDSEYVYSSEMKLRVKGCTVEAAATGDFGTANSEVRISFFQCTAKDSKGQEYLATTDKIKGWVYDESNLYGIESRVVSKEGEIFAKSIPLALLNTGMNIMSTAANNYTAKQTTTTTTGTTNISAPAAQTLTAETNSIMTRITDLWLKYLDAISPVVQFRAGRTVTVAFGGITKLKWEKVEMFQANKPTGKTISTSRRNYGQY